MSSILSQIQSRQAIHDFDVFNSQYQKKVSIFEHDPLVLACSVKDLLAKNPNVYYSLDDLRVSENITSEIVDQAEDIRKYFTKKFFWQALSDSKRLSDFRTRLCYLLENRVRKCDDNDCGIYYKLPWFYDEDMIYEDFKKTYETLEVPRIVHGGTHNSRERLQLTFLKSTFCYQRKRKIQRLWFTDQKYIYSIELEAVNPLLESFIDRLTSSDQILLEAYRNIDRIDNMYFYKIFNFKLTKE